MPKSGKSTRQSNKSRARFGTTDQLPSGRWRARYTYRGRRWKAPETFSSERRANKWLTDEETLIDTHTWTPPTDRAAQAEAESVTVNDAVDAWIQSAGNLAERSRTRYQSLRRNYVEKYLKDVEVREFTPAVVEKWVDDMQRPRGGKTTSTAGAYSLVHTVMRRLVTAKTIPSNPCTVDGAGTPPKSKKKVVPTPAQLAALVEAMPEAYEIAIQVAAWCALRPAEMAEVRLRDLERLPQASGPDKVLLHVDRQAHCESGTWTYDPPKGKKQREVPVPPHVVLLLDEQIKRRGKIGPDDLLFLNMWGKQINPAKFDESFKSRAKAICPGATPHSLRHFGAVTHQQAGATLKETMELLGHTTPQVAMEYQSVAHGRSEYLAERMSAMAGYQPPSEVEALEKKETNTDE